jgi:hypothetical protein
MKWHTMHCTYEAVNMDTFLMDTAAFQGRNISFAFIALR